MNVCVYASVYMRMQAREYASVRVCICVCEYVYAYASVCMRMRVCIRVGECTSVRI